MSFLTKTRELTRTFISSDEDSTNQEITDKEIREIIMLDPNGISLLKALANRKETEKNVKESINNEDNFKNIKNNKNKNSEVNIPEAMRQKYNETIKQGNKEEKERDD